MNLLTDDYMDIYSKISSQYFKDNIIFIDLITLLGNLANDNPCAQKIFYNTKLFDEYIIYLKMKKLQKIKEILQYFF